MSFVPPQSLSSAIDDFHRARNQAFLQEVLSRFTGESVELLSYEEVRKKLRAFGGYERGLEEIPLDAIVGSVGRYNDFTRDFLPRQTATEERWARIKVAATGLVGLPPIDVYKIGEAYFVKDGNHRVSVARRLGATSIQAYVTEVYSPVPITPDIQPDDLILMAEYAEFLDHTRLNLHRPDANLRVTIPGQYPLLEEHIAVHRHFMGNEQQREIPSEEAAVHWYDTVYLPVVQAIRERGILRGFPGRTETDLYLWIAEHRATLVKELGWEINPETVFSELARQINPPPRNVVARLGDKLLEIVSRGKLEPGPPPGEWRKDTLATHRDARLFTDILVPVNGHPEGWNALLQAQIIAQLEGARLYGLHLVPSEEQRESQAALAVQAEFDRRCTEAGIAGNLVIAMGEVARQISNRARWTDLVVTNLAYPPGPLPADRLDSGFRDLIQRCPRPVLAARKTISPLSRGLLAYDGSPKSQEALFVATYLAGRWQIPLIVITVQENGRVASKKLGGAQKYLKDHGVQATCLIESGPIAEAILRASESHNCDLLIMGGYGYNPVLEVVLGSTVDQVLRESSKPTLICR